MLPLEVQDTVEELINLYCGWSPRSAGGEMWRRMLARYELTGAEVIGVIRCRRVRQCKPPEPGDFGQAQGNVTVSFWP